MGSCCTEPERRHGRADCAPRRCQHTATGANSISEARFHWAQRARIPATRPAIGRGEGAPPSEAEPPPPRRFAPLGPPRGPAACAGPPPGPPLPLLRRCRRPVPVTAACAPCRPVLRHRCLRRCRRPVLRYRCLRRCCYRCLRRCCRHPHTRTPPCPDPSCRGRRR